MNMHRSNSDRATLLSGGGANGDVSSSGRKVVHDSDTATSSIFEQQNDIRLQELNSKLSALHKASLRDSFTAMRGSLTGTVTRLRHMTSMRHKQYMCYLIMCIVGIFFLFYYFWGYWRNSVDSVGSNDGDRIDV
ncbi:18282_t:CDS:2 [Acaulospora morrowiae]|uniref:18282_t:CDS:1 n=1 Tax=Acaulospora morrowiae TaxID=94023 RepID=A0A9N8VIM3_9GLOM|nr:18282_t:CDS:2 [Acaulospora morrowiae]